MKIKSENEMQTNLTWIRPTEDNFGTDKAMTIVFLDDGIEQAKEGVDSKSGKSWSQNYVTFRVSHEKQEMELRMTENQVHRNGINLKSLNTSNWVGLTFKLHWEFGFKKSQQWVLSTGEEKIVNN